MSFYANSENIFGYRDLKVNMWMSASTLKTFVKMDYGEIVDKAKADGVEPDPVLEPLKKLLAEGQCVESSDEMKAHMTSEKVINSTVCLSPDFLKQPVCVGVEIPTSW